MTDKWNELDGDIAKVLVRGNEIVILGSCNNDNDENHNCDVMGCTSVMCVLYRGWLRAKEIGVSTKVFIND